MTLDRFDKKVRSRDESLAHGSPEMGSTYILNNLRAHENELKQVPELHTLFTQMDFSRTANDSLVQNFRGGGAVESDSPHAQNVWTIMVREKGRRADNREDERYFSDKLSGHMLVDLGAGGGDMMPVAESYEASAYIGVDRNARGRAFDLRPSGRPHKGTPILFLQGDILAFVTALPDDSVNITINGMDVFVLGRNEHDYVAALGREIARAVRPGGVIFGTAMDDRIGDVLRLNKQLKTKQFDSGGYRLALDTFCYEKVGADEE